MDRPPKEPRPLYERQLDAILQGAARTQQRRQFWTTLRGLVGRALGGRGSGIPHSRLLLAGVVLAVVGVLLRGLLPAAGGLLILLGIVLFLSPVVLSFGRPRGAGRPAEEKLWRGRPVVYDDDPWQTARTRLNGVIRWFRGGSSPPKPPPRNRGRWN